MTTTAQPKSYKWHEALIKMRAKKKVVCLPTEEVCTIVEHNGTEHVETKVGNSLTRVPTIGFEKMYSRASFADALPAAAADPAK